MPLAVVLGDAVPADGEGIMDARLMGESFAEFHYSLLQTATVMPT